MYGLRLSLETRTSVSCNPTEPWVIPDVTYTVFPQTSVSPHSMHSHALSSACNSPPPSQSILNF